MTKTEKIRLILTVVRNTTGVSDEDLFSKTRKKIVYFARLIAVWHVHKVMIRQAKTAEIFRVTQPAVAYFLRRYAELKDLEFLALATKVAKTLDLVL